MKRLENVRVWVGGGVVAAILLAVAGWFLLVGPQLAHAAELRDQQEQAEQDNATLQAKVVTLKKQSQQLPTLVTDLRRAQAQLPPTPDLSGLATQINAHAAAADVTISSLTISGAEAVKSTTAAAPAAAAASPSAGSGGTGSATADSATATGDNAGGGSAAAGGAAGSGTGAVYAVTVSVTTGGTLAHQRAFLDRLSGVGPRAVLVGSTQLGAGADSGPGTVAGAGTLDAGSTMTSALTFFVAPQSAAAVTSLQKQLAAAQAG